MWGGELSLKEFLLDGKGGAGYAGHNGPDICAVLDAEYGLTPKPGLALGSEIAPLLSLEARGDGEEGKLWAGIVEGGRIVGECPGWLIRSLELAEEEPPESTRSHFGRGFEAANGHMVVSSCMQLETQQWMKSVTVTEEVDGASIGNLGQSYDELAVAA